MDTSQNGLIRLKDEEGVRLTAYWDRIGRKWTIGVGHTAAAGPPKVMRGMKITMLQAIDILRHDVVMFEDFIESVLTVKVNQNEFDALVSLTFNIGTANFKRSTVLRKLNANDRMGAANAFRLWNKGGRPRRVIRGLVKRRERERSLFLGE